MYLILGSEKLLVTTGYPFGSTSRKSEVIDILNSGTICEDLPDAPRDLYWGSGGMINGKPMVCGGNCDGCGDIGNMIDTCFFLGQTTTINMIYARARSSSIAINNTVRISINYLYRLYRLHI